MKTKLNRRRFIRNSALLTLASAAGAGAGAGLVHDRAGAATPIPRVGGPRIKISINAYSFNKALTAGLKGEAGGITLFDLLEFCAQHDFDAVDPTGYYFPGHPAPPPDSYIHELKRRAFHLGLDIGGTGIRNDFATPDKEKRAAGVRHVQEWIEVAVKLGAPVLRIFSGAVPAGYEDKWDEVAAWTAAEIRKCVEYGKQRGILIGVQNHGDMLKTADQVLKLIELVDSDWFGSVVDIGTFLTPDPYADIARVAPYAVNWQIKELVSEKGSRAPTDLKKLMRIVRDSGYRGYLPIETLPMGGREYNPHVRAPEFLREVREALKETA